MMDGRRRVALVLAVVSFAASGALAMQAMDAPEEDLWASHDQGDDVQITGKITPLTEDERDTLGGWGEGQDLVRLEPVHAVQIFVRGEDLPEDGRWTISGTVDLRTYFGGERTLFIEAATVDAPQLWG